MTPLDPTELPPLRGPDWETLWNRLVPDAGEADTVQGEVIRATRRVSSEYSRNGCMNWGPMYDGLCQFALERLSDGTFSPKWTSEIQSTLSRMLIVGRWYEERDALDDDDPQIEVMEEAGPGADVEYEEMDRMEQLAELWCGAHPEPIPYTATP